MALVDLDANDPFNPLKCAVTIGRAVLAKPGPKLAATRAISASASGRLSRGKGLSSTVSVSATAFVADMRRIRNLGTLEGPPATTAFGTIHVINSPSDGESVTVGAMVYTFTLAAAADPPLVTIEGTKAETIDNLVAAIEAISTDVVPFDDNPDVIIYAASPGAAGNGIHLSTNSPDLSLSGNSLAGGADQLVPPKVQANVSLASVVRQRAIGGSFQISSTASAALRVASFHLASSQFVRVTGGGTLDRKPKLGASPRVTVSGQAFLASLVVMRAGTHFAAANAKACLDPGRDGLGVCDVIREILLAWGIETPSKAPAWTVTRALHDLNSAMQMVWNQAKDRTYWSRSTITVTLPSGTSSHDLGNDIQNVVGPVRVTDSRQPLVIIGTIGELEQFADLYLDGDPVDACVGYHIERRNQPGKEPCKCVLHVTPAPTEDTEFMMDVVMEAPRFSRNDVDSCPRIPIPHLYVESLLLPIVRYHAMSCHLFVGREERSKQIESEYLMAVQGLEQADPLPGKAGDNINRREEART